MKKSKGAEISGKIIAEIKRFNDKVEKPILQVDALGELSEGLKNLIYTQLEDTEKEDGALIAIARFKEYLQILKEDGNILEYIAGIWWDRIIGIFSMYTQDLNDNISEIRLYGRILNFMRIGSESQDPRYVAGPELLHSVLRNCKAVIAYFELEDTLNIFKNRIPLYMIQDTEEKQNGGFMNARKFNAMCELIQELDSEFEYIPMQVGSEQLNETNEFGSINKREDVEGTDN